MKIYNDVNGGIVIDGECRTTLVFDRNPAITLMDTRFSVPLEVNNFWFQGFYGMSLWRRFQIAWHYFWKIIRATNK